MKAWSVCGIAVALAIALFTAPSVKAHHAIQAEYEMSETKAFTGTMTRSP